ncbi:MAG: PAS domain S-box protein [Dehalococcoidia bacterium]|nr:PAS domain S-box protein [Dehalococcoidia bacterium]
MDISGEAITFDGRPARLIVVHDVTPVESAEAARAGLSAIVEFSQDAMIVTSLEGLITTWSRGAEHLFGYSAAEVLGRSSERFFEPGEQHVRTAIRHRVINLGESIEGMERTWRRKDGSPLVTSSSYFPIRDAAGNVTGIGSVARDIGEQMAAEVALPRQRGPPPARHPRRPHGCLDLGSRYGSPGLVRRGGPGP